MVPEEEQRPGGEKETKRREQRKPLTESGHCRKPEHRFKVWAFGEVRLETWRGARFPRTSWAMNKSLDFFLRAVGRHWEVSNKREWYDRSFSNNCPFQDLSGYYAGEGPTPTLAHSNPGLWLVALKGWFMRKPTGDLCVWYDQEPQESPCYKIIFFHALPLTLKSHSWFLHFSIYLFIKYAPSACFVNGIEFVR